MCCHSHARAHIGSGITHIREGPQTCGELRPRALDWSSARRSALVVFCRERLLRLFLQERPLVCGSKEDGCSMMYAHLLRRGPLLCSAEGRHVGSV